MSEDRPLTEFVADEDAAEGDDTDADEAAAADDSDSFIDSDAEPATPTYRWQPDGATCAACGTTTERQWRDDEGFVCADCKSW